MITRLVLYAVRIGRPELAGLGASTAGDSRSTLVSRRAKQHRGSHRPLSGFIALLLSEFLAASTYPV